LKRLTRPKSDPDLESCRIPTISSNAERRPPYQSTRACISTKSTDELTTSGLPVIHPGYWRRSLPLLLAALIAGHPASNKAMRMCVHQQNALGPRVAQFPHTPWLIALANVRHQPLPPKGRPARLLRRIPPNYRAVRGVPFSVSWEANAVRAPGSIAAARCPTPVNI
jgi:hypothetical protein